MERKKSTVKELEKKINDLGKLSNALIAKLSEISDVLNGTNNIAFALLSQVDSIDFEKLEKALKSDKLELRDDIHAFIQKIENEIQETVEKEVERAK